MSSHMGLEKTFELLDRLKSTVRTCANRADQLAREFNLYASRLDRQIDQDIKDLAAYIIEQNRTGEPPLSANELAKRTLLWVGIGIAGMVFITLLLSQYNMRWIARRAAARRK